jgi:hypothetical protein
MIRWGEMLKQADYASPDYGSGITILPIPTFFTKLRTFEKDKPARSNQQAFLRNGVYRIFVPLLQLFWASTCGQKP